MNCPGKKLKNMPAKLFIRFDRIGSNYHTNHRPVAHSMAGYSLVNALTAWNECYLLKGAIQSGGFHDWMPPCCMEFQIAGCRGIIPLHPAIFEAGNTVCGKNANDGNQSARCPAHHTGLPLLLTQSNPPARKSLPPLWITPPPQLIIYIFILRVFT
jgi:hypothetical protein